MKFDFDDFKLSDLEKAESIAAKEIEAIGQKRFCNGGTKILKFTRGKANRRKYLTKVMGIASPLEHFKQIITSKFIVSGLDLLNIKTTPQLINEQNNNPCQITRYDGLSRFIGELGTVLSIGGAYSMFKLSEDQSHKKFLLQALQFAESFFGEDFFDYYCLRVSGIMWNDWMGDFISESFFIFDNDGTECVLLMISDSD